MRIFNQIRKVLLKKGQLKDYIKYALGEIVLVVIGILLALQINTWNEERKNRNEKLLTFKVLLQSFEKNKNEIENTNEELDRVLKITKLRIENTGPNIKDVNQSVIDSIRILDLVKLELANNLNSNVLIDNKNMSLLGDDIQRLLLDFISNLSKYKNSENRLNDLVIEHQKNHQKYIALINEMESDSTLLIDPKNKFNSNYMIWLRDRDNQNLSVETKWKIEQAMSELNLLEKINSLIIETLKSKLKDN